MSTTSDEYPTWTLKTAIIINELQHAKNIEYKYF